MARREEPPVRPTTRLHDDHIECALFEYTFLFANGDTAQVAAFHDDSDLREAVLRQRDPRAPDPNRDKIVGVSNGRFLGWIRIERP